MAELLVAVALTGLLLSVLSALYRAAFLFQGRLLREQPLHQTASRVMRFFGPAVNAATCARPADGAEGLVLYHGRDCKGGEAQPPDRIVSLCLLPDGRLLLGQGGFDDADRARLERCDPEYPRWGALTMPRVRASGRLWSKDEFAGLDLALKLDESYADDPPDDVPVSLAARWQCAGGCLEPPP